HRQEKTRSIDSGSIPHGILTRRERSMMRTYTRHWGTCGLQMRLNNGKRMRHMIVVLFLN
ncbi:MAG: hypothetical protein MJA29_08980, partial [Candidatus Omnitrophica bacterium]|nr:hypothetical protein [Candidatus Omnitrophota bacterium]